MFVGTTLKLNLQVTLRVPQMKVFRLLFVAYIYLSYFCTIKDTLAALPVRSQTYLELKRNLPMLLTTCAKWGDYSS